MKLNACMDRHFTPKPHPKPGNGVIVPKDLLIKSLETFMNEFPELRKNNQGQEIWQQLRRITTSLSFCFPAIKNMVDYVGSEKGNNLFIQPWIALFDKAHYLEGQKVFGLNGANLRIVFRQDMKGVFVAIVQDFPGKSTADQEPLKGKIVQHMALWKGFLNEYNLDRFSLESPDFSEMELLPGQKMAAGSKHIIKYSIIHRFFPKECLEEDFIPGFGSALEAYIQIAKSITPIAVDSNL